MKKLFMKFRNLKISVQFTVVIFLCIFLPAVLVSSLLIINTRETTIQNAMRDAKDKVASIGVNVDKAYELCSMSTQVFLSNTALEDYITKVKKGTKLPIDDIMEFYRRDMSGFEDLVLSNPYIYQMHIYVDSENLTEMMPILYKKSRMNRLSWASEEIVSGRWEMDYSDTLFNDEEYATVRHLMGLITVMNDFNGNEIGIVEASMQMDDIFPGLFDVSGNQWSCVVRTDGREYCAKESKWSRYSADILALFDDISKEQYVIGRVSGETVIVACLPLKSMNTTYIQLISLKEIEDENKAMRDRYWLVMLIALAILVFVINRLVKQMLRRVYGLFDAVNTFADGDLAMRVPELGNDEIAQFARSLNTILNKIRQLMEDNVNRELLSKNSEIKALQNQINVHFIYNVLESIKMMAEVDERYEIADAVNSLGRLLRYSMRWKSRTVTMREEIDYIKHYLALANLRFDYKITLVLEIPDQLMKQEVPKMSLQPLVENSVIHGMENIAEDAALSIRAEQYEGKCMVEVYDTGNGMSSEQVEKINARIAGKLEKTGGSGNGIGLKNVQDRIKMLYGEGYGISISSKEDLFTCVKITLPLKLIEGESEKR